jgi:hypothetical protein
MKQLINTIKLRKELNRFLRIHIVLCSFLSRIDKVQILTSEWSKQRKNWSLSFLSIGILLPWDGRSNYTTKTFAWVSYYDSSWHCGFLFFKIA